jgi:hypothetical protein
MLEKNNYILVLGSKPDSKIANIQVWNKKTINEKEI